MGLYGGAQGDVAKIAEAFPTVEPLRILLARHGFIPLCKVGDGEHWVRGSRRVILACEGETVDAEPKDLTFATPVQVGDDWVLSFD
jgi:hypothetical protein